MDWDSNDGFWGAVGGDASGVAESVPDEGAGSQFVVGEEPEPVTLSRS